MAGTEVLSVYVDMANHPSSLDLYQPQRPPEVQVSIPQERPGCFPWLNVGRRNPTPRPLPISIPPIVFDPTKEWSTIGDLHGNTLKLVYFLAMRHAVKISQADYYYFLKIYSQDLQPLFNNLEKGKEFYQAFDRWLSRMQVKPGAKIRLLGDELADRGRNDYYTLKIIHKLVQEGTDLEIIFSNHGLEFMIRQERRWYASQSNSDHGDPITELFNPALLSECYDSIDAMGKCMQDKLIDAKQVDRAYEAYISKIKVLSLDRNDQGGLNFYSHAPLWDTPLNVTIELVKTLRVNKFSEHTCPLDQEHMAELVDEINTCTQEAIRNHRLIELVQARIDGSVPATSIVNDCPFAKIAWHRPSSTGQYPKQQEGIDMFCGHDQNVGPATTSLDNTLGRDPKTVPQGFLTYLVSQTFLRPEVKNNSALIL